ncbi:MAG TPA: 30S ribosomal protein S18 [Lentisphaeria bacterium]|nr:30S ribosomal protein S18 [Lentisphaeria bacterium]HQC51980.1 30S ribosomal protein S18 [Lentisphaeria bacterium]
MKAQKPRRRRKVMRQKNCRLCENKIFNIDFKDVELLRRFQAEGGKILPRRITGNCFKHQKLLAIAVKRARILALVL